LPIQDFFINTFSLNPCDLCYKLSQEISELSFLTITADDISNNANLGHIQTSPNKLCIFYELPLVSLCGNLELYNFIAPSIGEDLELSGIVFKKKDYYVSLGFTGKGWVLFKNSGKQGLGSWAEGCVAAYEMGMTIYLLMYVRRQTNLEEAGAGSQADEMMEDLSSYYNSIVTGKY
jgi:hypothetical protein